jgi:Telomeric repeat-binding factor 2.
MIRKIMERKKIIIPLFGICLLILSLGSYEAMAANKKAKIVDQQPATPPSQDDHAQKIEEVNPQSTPSQSNPVTAPADELTSRIDDLVANGTFVEAKENGIYDQKKGVIIDKQLFVGLEGFRVVVDESSFRTGEYYIMADFSILNLTDNYVSKYSNFTLRDSQGFSYRPVVGPNTRGTISGNLKFKDSRRGEIAFYVPEKETQLELRFDTGIEAVKTIRFKIDTNPLINPPLPSGARLAPNQQAPY